jgi:hypothetical protein
VASSPQEEARRPATEENMVLPPEESVPLEEETHHGMDPELQPRTTFVQSFKEMKSLPAGYTAENLVLGAEGIQLAPPSDPDNPRREGTLTSANQATDFPSNSFAPLWLDKLPDGTEVNLEIAFSPNGTDWGPWSPVIRSDESEIEPVMPDGSPNPFFGYSMGPLFSWGSDQWDHFRFRVTLSSETAESPTVEAIRIYYQDSTMGDGQTGRLEELESVLPRPSEE